jgi:hypothetical protein
MTPQEEDTILYTGFAVATASMVCSILTLVLLKKMNRWNGYHIIIGNMTFSQLLYDVNYMLGIVPGNISCHIWRFLDVYGGLSCTLWSNILGFCVLYVAIRIKSAEIARRFWYFFALASGFPLVVAFLLLACDTIYMDGGTSQQHCKYRATETAEAIAETYYWTRILSICVNLLIYILISIKVRSLVSVTKGGEGIDALSELASRMKYYPLMQAISRSGAAWDEFGTAGSSGYFPSGLMRSICSPISGIGYFLIFVVMQPGMVEYLTSIMMYWTCGLCGDYDDDYDADQKLLAAFSPVSANEDVKVPEDTLSGHSKSFYSRSQSRSSYSVGSMRSNRVISYMDEDELEGVVLSGGQF